MNTKTIDNALLYYDIDDEQYKIQCYNCLECVNHNEALQKEFNDLFNILFVDKTNKVKELWNIKSINMLFSESVHPYVTNLLLLSGCEIHQKNINNYKLDEEQISIHKLRVKETLTNDIKLRKYKGIRISQMLWGSYFINMKLIEVGRLQYERENENGIKIHIPAGSKLGIDQVSKSLKISKFYIEKYFNLKNYNYYCNSWLLSKEIHNIVDKASNIYEFYELFDVESGESCIDDIINFVYQLSEVGDYKELPEKTSLQKNIKQCLIKGKDIKIGKGILKSKYIYQ